MKKIVILVLCALMLLPTLVACGNPEATTTVAPGTSTDVTTTTQPPETNLPEGEQLVKENYTAVLNDEEWKASGVDTSKFALFGTGASLYNNANVKYSAYTRSFYIDENGEEKKLSFKDMKALGVVGAEAIIDEAKKSVKFKLHEVEIVVQPEWKAVTAKAGTYLMFNFTTNLPMDYAVTVSAKEDGSQAAKDFTQGGISTSGKDGKYTGIAKCTVPYSEGKTFYINICADGGNYPVLATIPVSITAPKYDLPFQFIFQGDWDAINDKSYIDNLYEVLYNSYPRAYKRWAMLGDEPLVLYVVADKNSKEIAYNAGTKVVVQVGYANSSPADVGLFAHEFTHAIQAGYGISYSNGWFTEAMADYGRFRFFHWGYSTNYIKDYSMNDANIRDFRQDKTNPTSQWYGYAQHNVFMAYLDWVWPTTDKNNDGKITPDEHGLIDHIVYSAKMLTKEGKSPVSDYPYTEGSVFNNWVKEITGIATMDLVRQKFVKELDDGTFVFKGFRDYKDNFLIENVYDIPDLTYPMKEKVEPSAPTNPVLEVAMKSGDNLCLGAKIHSLTTKGSEKYAGEFLIDGDETTRYQAGKSTGLVSLNGLQNEIVIDLGEAKTFDTYTLISSGDASKTPKKGAKSWEILVSNDGSSYTAVDYQKDNTTIEVSVTFAEQTARYIKIRLYQADHSNAGTARLYEFMLFDSKK